ncbi:MAG: CBS domain-containing protein [Candidatus Latescibacteria bacterium]|nr:CBS domain-containing protein [Candidatus Latescibacterota bacterium]
MHRGRELPVVSESTSMRDVLVEMTSKQLGITCVVDSEGILVGVLTDGDLRRLMERATDPLAMSAREALNASPRGKKRNPPFTIGKEELAAETVPVLEKHILTQLVVVDAATKPIGVIRWIDLLKARVI